MNPSFSAAALMRRLAGHDCIASHQSTPFIRQIGSTCIAMACAFLLAACGGGEDAPAAVPVAAVQTPPATQSPPSASARLADQPYTGSDTFALDAKGTTNDLTEITAVTHHAMTINGVTLQYTATVGNLLIRATESNKPLAKISYVAFSKDEAPALQRPITFLFGDGIGGSSANLMLNAFGPRKLASPTDTALADNEATLLAQSDLVFVNPVGTGYSMAFSGNTNADFWNWDQDASADAKFIFRYLDVNNRVASPKFLLGDGNGAMRAALVNFSLKDLHGIAVNGVGLISPQWNSDVSAHPIVSVDERYLFPAGQALLPTIAMTARRHGKSAGSEVVKSEAVFRQDLRTFSDGQYAKFWSLVQSEGSRSNLPTAAWRNISPQVANYTGLTVAQTTSKYFGILGTADLISKNLLGNANQSLGIRDTRTVLAAGQAEAAVTVSKDAVNNYLRKELQFNVGSDFVVDNSDMARGSWVDTVTRPDLPFTPTKTDSSGYHLLAGILLNHDLKVITIDAYYDAVSPFYTTSLMFDAFQLEPDERRGVQQHVMEAGHSPHLDPTLRAEVIGKLGAFYSSTLKAMGLL